MRALYIEDGSLRYSGDFSTPRPGDGEALIKVRCAAICSTDLEIVRGYMNFNGIPGHEFVGVVEECGDTELVGRRVVGEINIGCGACVFCERGGQNHCPNRAVLGILNKQGAFADYLTLPAANLHCLPDSISDEEALFVEPLAAAFEILEQLPVGPGQRVCLFGDGKLGLLIAQVLAGTGCDLVVVGRHSEKLAILDRRGISTVKGTLPREGRFDIVVDATGSAAGVTAALQVVRPGGRVVLKTTVADPGGGGVDLNRLVIDEITLTGSRCGPFPPALEALERRSVDVIPLISKTFPLEEGLDAFSWASRKGVMKVVVTMGGEG